MKRTRINNQITASELRLVDEEGKNLGVFEIAKALDMAKEKEMDLIEVSPDAKPPVAKIMDYGKFLYQEKKKLKDSPRAVRSTETKSIRIHLGTSENDLGLKAKKASEFLREGHRLRLELFLKGREKYLDRRFLEERLRRILKFLSEDYKISENPKGGPRGMYMVVEKAK